jgi:hypothetical protein
MPLDRRLAPLAVALVSFTSSCCFAEETREIQVAGGAIVFDAPEAWPSVEPANQLIEHELAVAPPEGSNAAAARLTVMAAGGSVEANIARWIGQFQGTEGGADRDTAESEAIEVGGMKATIVEVAGTYLESAGGPFGPKTPRPGYRLVGAIVETQGEGNYFFKLVGPEASVEPASEAFREMLATLRKAK